MFSLDCVYSLLAILWTIELRVAKYFDQERLFSVILPYRKHCITANMFTLHKTLSQMENIQSGGGLLIVINMVLCSSELSCLAEYDP